MPFQLSGKVVLFMTVDEKGVPADVLVVSGHPVLADSAVEAAVEWRYTPMLLRHDNSGGWERVPMSATVTAIYSITGSGATVGYTRGPLDPGKNSPRRE